MASAIWQIMLELAPWLLLGALIAGLLHGLLPPGLIQRRLQGRGAVWQAVVLGVPLPLCSCGVIPAGIGLKKDGASNGAAIGFLISTPQTGVDSVMLSAAMLGWPFALFKVAAATITGTVGGYLADSFSEDESDAPAEKVATRSERRSVRIILSHGLEVIRSVWLWLVFGVVVSAAIETWVPPSAIGQINAQGGSFLSALAALVISLPLYVCATSSIPIAAALVAKGLPTGAALVFLMAGPATNVATMGAVYRTFGRRLMVLYLATIICGSVVAAITFDWLMPTQLFLAPSEAHSHSSAWYGLNTIAAVFLSGLFVWFAVEDLRRRFGGSPSQIQSDEAGFRIDVDGMTCQSCVRRLETDLTEIDGVKSASAQLNPGQVVVRGSADQISLGARIRSSGFEPTHFEAINN